jgi:LysM repeat protein
MLTLAVAVFGMAATLPAQDASAIADQQAAKENYQQMAGKIEDLVAANAQLQKQVTDLSTRLRTLEDAQSQPNTNAVDRGELRSLAEKVKEIDQKREADKDLILKQIDALAKLPPPDASGAKPKGKHKAPPADATATPDTGTSTADATPAPADNKNYEGYEHVVKPGETLSAIVAAYNKEQGLKLTVSQVLKHPLNAKVKPEKLFVGQKIFIPAATAK